MLIIFNQSGSDFSIDYQYDSFAQGDNNVHTIDIVVVDENFSNYNYNAFIEFLRNGEKTPSPQFACGYKNINYDGKIYSGYTFTMNNEWFTEIAGVLKATISIKKYVDGVFKSNKAYGIVNIPIQESVSAISNYELNISQEQFANLMTTLNTKFNKDDYDFKNLGTFENERSFAQASESDYYTSQRENKNFLYKGYITANGNQSTALCLVGYTAGSGMNFDSMVISHKGITCYKQGNEVATLMPKVEVSDLKVNVSTSVPYPSNNESIANKYYVDSNHYKKSEIDSSFQNIETNLNYNIQGALDSSKSYTDSKYIELKALLDTLLNDAPTAYDTLKEIADYIASDKSGASEMLAKINNNTSEINVIKQGLPETLDIILRSEVSEGTTEEVKEMEINGMEFKVGSATSSDSAIKGKLVASGTLEWQEDESAYKRIYDFEERKLYVVSISDSGNYLGYCVNGVFDTPILKESWGGLVVNLNQSGGYLNIYDVVKDDVLGSAWNGFSYEIYELVAPVGSSSSGGTSNQILTLSDVDYEIDFDGEELFLYVNEELNGKNLTIDLEEVFYEYLDKKGIYRYSIVLDTCTNTQVLIKASDTFLDSVYYGVQEEGAVLGINYVWRLTAIRTEGVDLHYGISTYPDSSCIMYVLNYENGETIVKVDFDAFGNGTSYGSCVSET